MLLFSVWLLIIASLATLASNVFISINTLIDERFKLSCLASAGALASTLGFYIGLLCKIKFFP